jgi:hypothetical protein
MDIQTQYPDIPEGKGLVDQRMALDAEIAKGHDYRFIGRVGEFCPILPGKGGGLLMRRSTDGKYSSVAASKGYRWLEAADVRELHYEDNIEMSYFRSLADEAVDTIRKFGDFDTFVQDDKAPPFNYPYEQKLEN